VIASSIYMLVFRIVHIAAAVAWGGSVFFLVAFVQPSAASVGPAAGPFIGELLGRRKVVDAMLRLGEVTVLGGLFLYWHDAQVYGGLANFVGSAFGLAITVGAVSAIAALLVGQLGTKPVTGRLVDVGRQVAEAGGPPHPDIAAELSKLQVRGRKLARTNLALIAIAVFAMATARYW
jgi:hypothetical protein